MSPTGGANRAVLAAVALAVVPIPLNSTMIAVALPEVADDFGTRVAAVSWLVTAYLIAMALLQPLTGRVGDRVGRRAAVVGGLVLFGAASVAAAVAPSVGVLIAARTLQAVAGAIVFPNAVALLRDLLPAERRGSGFGVLGAAIGIAAALGPPLGGLLVGVFGWRAVFVVNVPLVAAALALAWRALPRRTRARAAAAEPAAAPVRIVALLRRRGLAAATGAVGLSNLSMYATLLCVPVLLSRRGGWSGEEVGALLAAFSVAMVVLSPVGGRLADRHGRRSMACAGLALFAAGCAPLGLAGSEIGGGLLLAALTVAGAGMGLSNAALQTAAVEALAARDAGVASGVYSSGRYLGGIVAALLLGAATHGSQAGALDGLLAVISLAGLAALIVALVLPADGRAGRVTTERVRRPAGARS